MPFRSTPVQQIVGVQWTGMDFEVEINLPPFSQTHYLVVNKANGVVFTFEPGGSPEQFNVPGNYKFKFPLADFAAEYSPPPPPDPVSLHLSFEWSTPTEEVAGYIIEMTVRTMNAAGDTIDEAFKPRGGSQSSVTINFDINLVDGDVI